jgi:hypothetical protein
LIKFHKATWLSRGVTASIQRGVFCAFCFSFTAHPGFAQTQTQLPHAWSEAVYALAEKTAGVLPPGRTFSAEVNDVSGAAPVGLADLRRAFEQDMLARGMRSGAAPADAQVEISVSRSLVAFELIAEIRRADAEQLAIVPVAADESAPLQPSPQPGLQRKVVWQQATPLLDFDQISGDAGHTFWYLLEPERLAVYEFDSGQQILSDAKPIARRYATRDLRGWLQAADATHVNAFVGAMRCDASWNPSLTIDCQENPGQQWPMGPVSWTFVPSRNYFTGTVTFSSSLQAKFPPFYSSASPLPGLPGEAPSRRVVAGVDGRAQLFEGGPNAESSFEGWGSEVASIAGGCGSNWQILATGTSDWTQKDQIQLYEIRDTKAIAIGQPLELPGPTLALWPSDDGKSARVISRNLESGLYEASIVSTSCGN